MRATMAAVMAMAMMAASCGGDDFPTVFPDAAIPDMEPPDYSEYHRRCRESQHCTVRGQCFAGVTYIPGIWCVAGADEDCRAADICKVKGRCFAETVWDEHGEPISGWCYAGDKTDCLMSVECQTHRRCKLCNKFCSMYCW